MNQLKLAFTMASFLAFPGSGFADQDEQAAKPNRLRAGQESERPANPRAKFRTDRMNRGQANQAGQFDPAMFVSRLMKQFDTDGDQKLDMKELTTLMTDLRDRRQSGGITGQRGRGTATGKEGNRSMQRNNRPTPSAGDPGGDRPIRPSAD